MRHLSEPLRRRLASVWFLPEAHFRKIEKAFVTAFVQGVESTRSDARPVAGPLVFRPRMGPDRRVLLVYGAGRSAAL